MSVHTKSSAVTRTVRHVRTQSPATGVLACLVVALGVATGSLWSAAAAARLVTDVGYGLTAFEDGRWWTVGTGAFFAVSPLGYVPVLVGLLLIGGFAERRLGTARAVAVGVASHVVGVVGGAVLLDVTRRAGWDWAVDVAGRLDLGPSAGFLGAAAAATATLGLQWRGRLRVVLIGYVVVSLLYIGGAPDVEHLLAVGFGLLLGPALQGRRPFLGRPRLTRRDQRRLASGFLVATGLAAVISSVSPVSGPLTGPETHERLAAVAAADGVPGGALLHAIVFIALARPVLRGSRRGWWLATSMLFLVTLVQVGAAVAIVGTDRSCWPVIVDNAALNVVGLGIMGLARRSCANPSRRRSRWVRETLYWPGDESQRSEAMRCLGERGAQNRLAWMTTWPDNRWFFSEAHVGYVAHRVHAGVALGVGDPVGADLGRADGLVRAFAARARRDGLVPCFFGATEAAREAAGALGWKSIQVAEEAIIDLGRLDFRGKAWQDVRTALNQAGRRGIRFELGPLASMTMSVRAQVEEISALWVQDKGLPELGFTLGGVDEALDPHVRVGLAIDEDGCVHGVTSWLPVHRPGDGRLVGWTLDVMRRRPDGFRGVMEFVIANACLTFAEEGVHTVSLSAAPLARVDSNAERRGIDAFLDRLGAELEPLYGFRSLQSFKAKFQPRYEPLHLLYPDEAALPRIGVALTRAYLPSAGWRDLLNLARQRPAPSVVEPVADRARAASVV